MLFHVVIDCIQIENLHTFVLHLFTILLCCFFGLIMSFVLCDFQDFLDN